MREMKKGKRHFHRLSRVAREKVTRGQLGSLVGKVRLLWLITRMCLTLF